MLAIFGIVLAAGAQKVPIDQAKPMIRGRQPTQLRATEACVPHVTSGRADLLYVLYVRPAQSIWQVYRRPN